MDAVTCVEEFEYCDSKKYISWLYDNFRRRLGSVLTSKLQHGAAEEGNGQKCVPEIDLLLLAA